MHFRLLAQPLGAELGSDIPLRVTQQLVTHHKLAHRSRAQQRRKKVHMQVPFGMLLTVGGAVLYLRLVELKQKRKSDNTTGN